MTTTAHTLNAISLFSGCGGDTLGLERAGFKVVAFNEFNKAAAMSHVANFPHSAILVEPKSGASDITKVPDEVFQPYKGQINLVFAGFPCQGFSKAGKKSAADPRNQMFRQFVRVVKVTEPTFIIGENVSGLLSMKSGPKDDDPLVLEIIRKAFDEIGYSITYKVLDATDFGVPQQRKRLLIIGWRRDVISEFAPESVWASISSWGAAQTLPKLSSFVKGSLSNAFELTANATPLNIDTVAIPVEGDVSGEPHPYVKLKANAIDQTYNEKTYDRLLSCGKRDSPIHSEIVDLNKPSKTIICTYDHQPRLLVGMKRADGKAFVRCFTPDELKQIQGFPADFILCGNQKEKIVQAGNAVPPNLVTAVATTLKGLLVPTALPALPASVQPEKMKVKKVAKVPKATKANP
jgi:DNA (cytosine-5)-methyltransferase 1